MFDEKDEMEMKIMQYEEQIKESEELLVEYNTLYRRYSTMEDQAYKVAEIQKQALTLEVQIEVMKCRIVGLQRGIA